MQRAPGIPCALFSWVNDFAKTRAHRAAGTRTHILPAVLKIESISVVVPDKRANGSRERAPDDRLRERDPGPISTNVRCYARLGPQPTHQHASVVMGPRVRGDDSSTRRLEPLFCQQPHLGFAFIGLAEGETRWRGMTIVYAASRSRRS